MNLRALSMLSFCDSMARDKDRDSVYLLSLFMNRNSQNMTDGLARLLLFCCCCFVERPQVTER